jgi:rhodanese-related sulfurtransferase
MTQAGLRNVFALQGGLDAWQQAGMPLVPKSGEDEQPTAAP